MLATSRSSRAPHHQTSERIVPAPWHRSDIEGLRALAILIVVGYHASIPGFSGGYVGVDVFFVLSGYLITWLLVHEAEEHGTVDLKRFYARRARRLLPAAAVMLLATVVVGAIVFAPFEQRIVANTAFATAAYLSNLFFARTATDYLGASAETNPLLHTWSLSVEEQFYLLWPLFVLFAFGALRWQQRRGWGTGFAQRLPAWAPLLIWMSLATAVSFALSHALTDTRQPWAFFGSPARAWEFAAGALGVIVPAGLFARALPARLRARLPVIPPAARRRGLQAMALLGFAGLAACTALYDEATPFPGVAALLPVVSTLLLLRAGSERDADGPAARLLAAPTLQYLGRLSYSWYLWHWPVLVFAAALVGELSLPGRVALMAFALLVAHGSYHLIENPIRHHRGLARRSAYSLRMAVAVTFCSLALAFAWRTAAIGWAAAPDQMRYTEARADIPAVYASGCHATFYETAVELAGCVAGAEDADRTVVLLGDSHAAQWYPALKGLADTYGWRLISLTKSACPAVEATKYQDHLRRDYWECDAWRADALDVIDTLQPTYVVVASSENQPFSVDAWEAGSRRVIERLSAAAEHVVVIRDTPVAGHDAPTCLARHAWRSGDATEACGQAAFEADSDAITFALARAVDAVPGTSLLDFTPHLCPDGACALEADGVVVYRDAHHLTTAFVRRLAPTLDGHLTAVAVAP